MSCPDDIVVHGENLIEDEPGGPVGAADAVDEFVDEVSPDGEQLTAEPTTEPDAQVLAMVDDDHGAAFHLQDGSGRTVGVVGTELVGDTNYVHAFTLCAAVGDGEVSP